MRTSCQSTRGLLVLGLTLLLASRLAAQPATPPPMGAKTYPFEVREKAWRNVFEWLADKTQLPLIASAGQIPTGTLSFIAPVAPNGKPREYTLPQIIDIINESMRVHEMMVVRREGALVLVSTTRIDDHRVPILTPAELAKYGRTEPVSVVLPLRMFKAKEVAAEARQLLGASGDIAVLAKTNSLLLRDTAGNVARAIAILKLLESPPSADTKIVRPAPVEHAGFVPPDTKIAFEMRAVPWKHVLEWLSDRSVLPVLASEMPAGTFSFIGPKDAKVPAAYTIAQIVDIINDALVPQRWRLVRRPDSFQLVKADGRLDPDLVPHIDVADLNRRGRSEVVSITLPVKAVGGADGARDVRKLMGSFGSVVVLPGAERVVLEDTVQNLRRICMILGVIQPAADLGSQPKVPPQPKQPKPPDVPKQVNDRPTDDQVLSQFRVGIIATAGKWPEAFLHSPERRPIRMRAAPYTGFNRFRIWSDALREREILDAQVLRIESRDVYFAANDHVYRLHMGDSLKDALRSPLPADAAKQLRLSVGR
jgi:hypothetical protein